MSELRVGDVVTILSTGGSAVVVPTAPTIREGEHNVMLVPGGSVYTMDVAALRLQYRPGTIDEIDRNARAYGWDVGQGAPLDDQIESRPGNPFLDPKWRERNA